MFAGKALHAAVGRIALVMCLSCASAGIVQVIVSTVVQMILVEEQVNTNEVANVVLGALVAVTGCAPFMDPPYAILIGGKLTSIISHKLLFREWVSHLKPSLSLMEPPPSQYYTKALSFCTLL